MYWVRTATEPPAVGESVVILSLTNCIRGMAVKKFYASLSKKKSKNPHILTLSAAKILRKPFLKPQQSF
jgi:hypothetical protein